jgi:hypothetical protein
MTTRQMWGSWAVLAALPLATCLVGCGGGGDGEDPSTQATAGTSGAGAGGSSSGSSGTGATSGSSGSSTGGKNTGGSSGAGGTSASGGSCATGGHGSVNGSGEEGCAGSSAGAGGDAGSSSGSAGVGGSSGAAGTSGNGGSAGSSIAGSAGVAGSSGAGEGGSSGAAGSSAGTAGDAGAAGNAGSAGDSSGGSSGDAGSAGSSGSASTGGSTGSGGDTGSGGSLGGSGGDGGSTGTSGSSGSSGASGDGGSSGSSGSSGNGGTTGGTGGTDAGGSSGSGGTSGQGGSSGGPQAFACSGWTRDASFDAFKIDGTDDVKLVGGIVVLAANNIYITSSTYAKGVVAHWDGTNWTQENPKDSSGNAPDELRGIWYDGVGTICVAGASQFWTKGLVSCKAVSGGSWTPQTVPSAKTYNDGYTDPVGNDFLIAYTGSGINQDVRIAKNGVNMTLPTHAKPAMLHHIWGLDATHIYAVGELRTEVVDQFGGKSYPASKAVLWFFNGTSWTDVSGSTGAVTFASIHGTSPDDLVVSAVYSSGTNAIYELTSGLTTWTKHDVNTLVPGPVWSKYAGTFLGGANLASAGLGTLRIVTNDASSLQTVAIDGLAYNSVGFSSAQGSSVVHLVHISYPGVVAGHYVGDCH